MRHHIRIRDELVLEAHLDADEPHILLRREGEPATVRVHLNEVRDRLNALDGIELAEVERWVLRTIDGSESLER